MREVILYSDLEYDNWILVETDSTVDCYCEQEKEIRYVFDDKWHTTIFDMWIRYIDETECYIEVKYSNELIPGHRNYEKNMQQIGAQRQWCMENNIEYRVVTEKNIRKNRIALENRTRMLSFIKNIPYTTIEKSIFSSLSNSHCSLEQLSLLHPEIKYNIIQATCFWAIYKGQILSNIDNVIWGFDTEVWLIE